MLGEEGVGCIAFSPLAQGMLTDRYLDGIPADSRAAKGVFLSEDMLTEDGSRTCARSTRSPAPRPVAGADGARVGAARRAGHVGAGRRVERRQLDDTLGALDRLDFSDDELAAIDRHAVDAGINLWEQSSG